MKTTHPYKKPTLKSLPTKRSFLKKLMLLGYVISPDGIQPIAKRVKDLKILKSLECKRDGIKVLGCLGLQSC